MIAPLALILATAFWAPSNGGQPVCNGGVQVAYFADGPQVEIPAADGRPALVGYELNGWSWDGSGCSIHLREDAGSWPVAFQGAVAAHELGHSVFSLPHSADPGNIMYGGATVVPGFFARGAASPSVAGPRRRCARARNHRCRRPDAARR